MRVLQIVLAAGFLRIDPPFVPLILLVRRWPGLLFPFGGTTFRRAALRAAAAPPLEASRQPHVLSLVTSAMASPKRPTASETLSC